MPYNEDLARRVREHLSSATQVTEQEMFGGITFLIAGHMCCGVLGNDVIVRIDPTLHHDALTRPGVGEFEMGGRTSKGMVRVGPAGTTEDLDLALWVRLGMNYASELPARAARKAAAARKRGRTTPAKKAPARKKATPATKKTAPAKKKASARTRPAPQKKKAAAVKSAASVRKTSKAVKKAKKKAVSRSSMAPKKRPSPAGKKATRAKAKKVAKGKGPRTRK